MKEDADVSGRVRVQIIGGNLSSLVARQKRGQELEIGELLVGCSRATGDNILLQVVELLYGSQVSQQGIEMISGMDLEEQADFEMFDPDVRTYTIARLRPLVSLSGKPPKSLPGFLTYGRDVRNDDLAFLTKPETPLVIGGIRSGSRELDLKLSINGEKSLSHHVLIAATTGRGKSNMLSCILWDSIDKDYCGFLILDPHDEYYGRTGLGLKDHGEKNRVVYYTSNDVPAGARSLKINLKMLRPWHFNGVAYWSEAQTEALAAYYRNYRENWVEAVMFEREVQGFQEGTIAVLKRRLMSMLDIDATVGGISCHGIFDLEAGQTTIKDIATELESANNVIIDTSQFYGSQELLIGSMISWEIFMRYRKYKADGVIGEKPVVSIILEEAPRVLGKDVLERGSNIFSTIAREGRKFRVGLMAITQMPSLIPRTILANMNTKIILGLEMKPERDAIIDSAAQDLSQDERNIASLAIGEAIISSTFTKFAVPVKIPLFKDVAEKSQSSHDKTFSGLSEM